MKRVLIARCADWGAVYIDGDLCVQGESLASTSAVEAVSKAIGADVLVVMVDRRSYEGGLLPMTVRGIRGIGYILAKARVYGAAP